MMNTKRSSMLKCQQQKMLAEKQRLTIVNACCFAHYWGVHLLKEPKVYNRLRWSNVQLSLKLSIPLLFHPLPSQPFTRLAPPFSNPFFKASCVSLEVLLADCMINRQSLVPFRLLWSNYGHFWRRKNVNSQRWNRQSRSPPAASKF